MNDDTGLVWIDTTNGTWGMVRHDAGALMIVDLTALVDEESDEYSLLAALDAMDDGEVAEFALKYGKVVQP